ncbi:30S ribosomal protein S6 [bacterium]|nr:30S ribosomal protein S6 [bacterium]
MSSADVQNVQNEELEKYELMVILMADLSQDDTEKELQKIKKLISDATGEIYHEDIWDVRDLAYIINKQDKGYYVIYYFTLAESKHLVEMERELTINNTVIRHLLVKSPKNYKMKKLADLEFSTGDRRTHRVDKDAPPASPAPKPRTERTPAHIPAHAPAVHAAPAPAKVAAPAPAPVAPKEIKKTMDISDLDSQLESLLDDPDINIKL